MSNPTKEQLKMLRHYRARLRLELKYKHPVGNKMRFVAEIKRVTDFIKEHTPHSKRIKNHSFNY